MKCVVNWSVVWVRRPYLVGGTTGLKVRRGKSQNLVVEG